MRYLCTVCLYELWLLSEDARARLVSSKNFCPAGARVKSFRFAPLPGTLWAVTGKALVT